MSHANPFAKAHLLQQFSQSIVRPQYEFAHDHVSARVSASDREGDLSDSHPISDLFRRKCLCGSLQELLRNGYLAFLGNDAWMLAREYFGAPICCVYCHYHNQGIVSCTPCGTIGLVHYRDEGAKDFCRATISGCWSASRTAANTWLFMQWEISSEQSS